VNNTAYLDPGFVAEFNALRRSILSVNRYQVPKARDQLARRIAEIGERDSALAEYLQIVTDYSLGGIAHSKAVQRLKALLTEATSPMALAHAYLYLAKLTLKVESVETNYRYREAGLHIARTYNLHLVELVTLANWAIAALELDDEFIADAMVRQVSLKLSSLPNELLHEPEVDEVRGRLSAIQGKVVLRGLRKETDLFLVARQFAEAKHLYDEALAFDRTNAHRQVNTRAEFALETLSLPMPIPALLAGSIDEVLDEAHAGLDAHQCDACRALYYEARSKASVMRGSILRGASGQAAVGEWQRGVEHSQRRTAHLDALGHPEKEEAMQMTVILEQLIAREEQPRQIFLSHSGKDKDRVRQFSRALAALAYEPWLDEDALVAGAPLERGLREGLARSCAAVFFVTKDFTDSGYLATEVDYAVEEKRAKDDRFAIVTLVLDKDVKDRIPALLRRFVWKEPTSDLEALVELVRAVPLQPVRPSWRQSK